MGVQEIGRKLVEMCNDGRADEASRELYADGIVSIEAQDFAGMPARMEGIKAVAEKGEWWSRNHEIHSFEATGPFVGHRDDQFAVKFDMDITPTGGERTRMSEVAIYTLRDGKIVQEEFLYQA